MKSYVRSFLCACVLFLTLPTLAQADWDQFYVLSAGLGADTLTDEAELPRPTLRGTSPTEAPSGAI